MTEPTTEAPVSDNLLQAASAAYEAALTGTEPPALRTFRVQVHNYPQSHQRALRAAVMAVAAKLDLAGRLCTVADELTAESHTSADGAGMRYAAKKLRDSARGIEQA